MGALSGHGVPGPDGSPGFLGGCDLWDGWGSWYPGSRIPPSFGSGQCKCSWNCGRRQGTRVGRSPGELSLGINTETLRNWVNQVEADSRQRPGTTTEDKKQSPSRNGKTVSCAGRMSVGSARL